MIVRIKVRSANARTLEVALDTRRRNTLGQDSSAALDSPRDQQSGRIFAQLGGDFLNGGVIDDTGT